MQVFEWRCVYVAMRGGRVDADSRRTTSISDKQLVRRNPPPRDIFGRQQKLCESVRYAYSFSIENREVQSERIDRVNIRPVNVGRKSHRILQNPDNRKQKRPYQHPGQYKQ